MNKALDNIDEWSHDDPNGDKSGDDDVNGAIGGAEYDGDVSENNDSRQRG